LDLDEIQRLANLVKESDLHELEIERGNLRLKIVNRGATAAVDYHGEHSAQLRHGAHAATAFDGNVSNAMALDDGGKYHLIKSPIVGTFYRAPSPEAADFVVKNDRIESNSTVCIIEAMKVMNEIQAEVSGIVEEIFAQNGQPVEFGQPLFKVRKS
jgi:acetyl-CoA carboxylase biotin carboxyl carrier protein